MTRRPTSSVARCRACRADLAAGARFCAACGRPSVLHMRAVAKDIDCILRPAAGSGQAITILISGILLSVVIGHWLQNGNEPSLAAQSTAYALCIATGALALWRLGGARFADSAPLRVDASGVGAGVLAGLVALAASAGYVYFLSQARASPSADEAVSWPLPWITIVAMPALVEEWLCRGILWLALLRVCGPRATVGLTALSFALLHGLEASWFSYPHRFVAGLLFGWLRLRFSSLVPGIVAHGVLNGMVVALA